jgi:phenylacetate-CoA ligase
MNTFLSKHLVLPAVRAAKKQPIVRFLQELKETEHISRSELDAYVADKFTACISSAGANAPYYSTLLKSLGITSGDAINIKTLEEIPLMTRETYEEKQADMTVPADRVAMASTSGTSGKSIYIPRSGDDRAFSSALKYRHQSWYGIGIGAREIRVWRRVDDMSDDRRGQMKQTFQDTLLNIKRISPLQLTVDKLDSAAKLLESSGTKFLRGYSQGLYQLAEYIISCGRSGRFPSVSAAIPTGESISAYQQERIGTAFGCPVAEEYGANECGIIAMKCPAGNLHVQEENVIVEVLKEGIPAPDGESGMIAITTLGNRAVPFLRYVLGDVGALSSQPCSCGMPHKVLKSLHGRSFPYVPLPNGGAVNLVGFFVFGIMPILPGAHEKIRAFQFVHIEPHVIELRIDAEKSDFDLMKDSIQASLGEFSMGILRVILKNAAVMEKDPGGKQPLYIPLSANSV